MKPSNDTFLRALASEATDYTPVWLMRQAGRYLPEYNRTRARAGSFLGLCRDPELATEVLMQPLTRFDLDAAIVFSDILTIPDAMGLGLDFAEGEGPRFARVVNDEASVAALAPPDLSTLRYVFDAVAASKRALAGRIPLIGFAGSPFTLACYMIEGAGSRDFATVRRMRYARPDLLARILDVNARAVAAYLAEQVKSGADAIMIFDTWGGILGSRSYAEFSLTPIERVIALMHETAGRRVPVIVFTKGGGAWLAATARCGCDAVGVDWSTDLARARADAGAGIAVQGNLDPAALLGPRAALLAEAACVLDEAGDAPGYVFNLGHGIMPSTPPENVAALVEFVHAQSRRRRQERTSGAGGGRDGALIQGVGENGKNA